MNKGCIPFLIGLVVGSISMAKGLSEYRMNKTDEIADMQTDIIDYDDLDS